MTIHTMTIYINNNANKRALDKRKADKKDRRKAKTRDGRKKMKKEKGCKKMKKEKGGRDKCSRQISSKNLDSLEPIDLSQQTIDHACWMDHQAENQVDETMWGKKTKTLLVIVTKLSGAKSRCADSIVKDHLYPDLHLTFLTRYGHRRRRLGGRRHDETQGQKAYVL